MRRWLAVALLVACAAWAVPGRSRDRFWSRFWGRGTFIGGAVDPWLQFAPATAAGLTASCAGSAVTGALGETVAVTRASAEFCSKKGLATTSIANGDLVSVSNNLPSVEPDLDGVLGVAVLPSAQALDIQNQDPGNVAWTKGFVTVGIPVVIQSDGGTAFNAPDNTNTARRVIVSACPGAGNASYVFQNVTGSAGATLQEMFVKGTSSSGNLGLWSWDSTGVTGQLSSCAFNSTTWTWCRLAYTYTHTTQRFAYGCDNDATIAGATDTGAADVMVWQPTLVNKAVNGATITTAAAAVTRAADVVAITPVSAWGATTIDAALYWSAPNALTASAVLLQQYKDANNSLTASVDGTNHLVCTWKIGGVSSTATTTGTLTASASQRVRCYYDGASRAACIGAACVTTAGVLVLPTGAMTVYVGSDQAGANQGGGVYSRLAVGPMGVNP